MKTVSGLTERHLRFDILAFISQLRKIESQKINSSLSTHPSMLIRAKALLWLSLSDQVLQNAQLSAEEELRKIDERIERDLDKFVDGVIREKIAKLKEDLLLWMVATNIVERNAFTARMQTQVSARFGLEIAEKLRTFLGSLSKPAAESAVFEKLIAVRDELEATMPTAFLEQFSLLKQESLKILENTH